MRITNFSSTHEFIHYKSVPIPSRYRINNRHKSFCRINNLRLIGSSQNPQSQGLIQIMTDFIPTSRQILDPNRLVLGPMLPSFVHPTTRRWKQRLIRLGIAFGVLSILVLVHQPLLAKFAGLFRVDNPAPSDAIMILLGGPEHRPDRAAELYRLNLAPLVLIGTASVDPLKLWKETEVSVEQLVRLGVPRTAIRVLPGMVTSTREEAQKLAEYAINHPLKRVTVVTTSFHTARALWILRRELKGTGIEIRMAAASHADYEENNWYRTDEGLVAYFTESLKTVYYRLRY